MKTIAIKGGLFALVDDEDYEELKRYKWFIRRGKKTNYARRSQDGKEVAMHHHLIGRAEGLRVDHVDGNGLNNQKNNIRHVTGRQNSQNIKTVKTSSRFPGVHWHKRDKRWQSAFRIGNTKTHIGSFTKEEEAFFAYREALNNRGELLLPEWQNYEACHG